MKVSSANPMAEVATPGYTSVTIDDDTRRQRLKTFGKAFGFLAVVGVSIGVGYAIGNGSGIGDSGPKGPIANARAVMLSAVQGDNELFSQAYLNWTALNTIVDEYEADDGAFDNSSVITTDIAAALKTYRDSAEELDQTSRLRRELANVATSYPSWVRRAWDMIDAETYSNGVSDANDQANVRRDASRGECYIIAEESNVEILDWVQNLDLGNDPIMSLRTRFGRDSSCGCRRRPWYALGFCTEYYACDYHYEVAKGFDGFIKSYNNLRLGILSRMNSRCASSDTRILAGYSRGAGILNPLAYSLLSEGILSSGQMRMATFGSPRSLKDAESDYVHSR